MECWEQKNGQETYLCNKLAAMCAFPDSGDEFSCAGETGNSLLNCQHFILKGNTYSCLPWRSMLHLPQICAFGGWPLWTVPPRLPFPLSPYWETQAKDQRIGEERAQVVYFPHALPPWPYFWQWPHFSTSLHWAATTPWLQVWPVSSIPFLLSSFFLFPLGLGEAKAFVLVARQSIAVLLNHAYIL